MEERRIRGVTVAMVTPLHDDESLNLEQMRPLVDRLINAGVNGVFVSGGNGEFYAFSEDERRRIMEAAIEAVSGRAWVIIHVGAATTAESKRLAAIAADYGADAVSVIAPYFISVSEAQIERHYAAVMDDARVPVLLYDVPMRTGNRVPSNVVGRLSRHPNCSGIKVSVDEIAAITEPLTHAVNNFSVYCGEDTLILDALEAGAAGFISGLANIVPETAVDLYRAFRNGDRDRAAQAQERLKVLAGIAKLGNGGTMVKRACELLGLRVGPSREPARIDPGVDAHLTQILAHAKLATTAAAQK